ncbi:MAG: hypothetical protein IJK93_09700 [Muribaculaceae bacterium]|nr:hypothetical protein [Muribaculaceae bacterium]
MKKFLFTLTALLFAGTVMADTYFYIPDMTWTQEQLGTEITVDVMLHCDAAFNAFTCELTYDGAMDVDDEVVTDESEAMVITYQNNKGKTKTADVSANIAGDANAFMGFTGATGGYWNPSGDGATWEYYGAIKWEPMEEDVLFVQLLITPSADFTGGTIAVKSIFSCGQEERPIPTVGANYEFGPVVCNITLEGATPPEPLPWEGEIVIGEPTEDGHVAISYTGTEDCTIVVTLNGEVVELVDGQIQLVEGANVIAVTVSADNHDDLVATAEYEWTAPEPPVVYTDKPNITYVDDPEAQTVTVTATGNGHIILMWDEQVMAEGEGEAVWVIPYGDDPEGEEYGVSATAQEPGKEVSEPAVATVFVPGKSGETPPEPPVDPTDEGYWLILVWADGTEVPYELMLGSNGDYVDVQNLEYPQFVDVACFYFKIDGVAYGAAEDMTPAFLGEADMNPLTPNTNVYFVENGYAYTIGIHLIMNEDTGEVDSYSAYVAKGGAVEVEELVNGKTVAGVRYFNLAGQEMQEANGMTIVVTTYTDGTTSAVKVMK